MQLSSIRSFNAVTPTSPAAKPEAAQEVEFSYNSQDRLVMDPGTTVLKGVEAGPKSERFIMKGTSLKPNADGDYVFDAKDPRSTSAVAFSAAQKTLETFEEAYGGKVDWAFRRTQMGVYPDHQDRPMLNAYYSRNDGSVNFFHDTDKVTGTLIQSGSSGDVVSHEVGHAILDGLRPGYLAAWNSDTGGFHESFADSMAILMGTQDEAVVAMVVKQNGGDLSKPSVISGVAEELGRGINNATGTNRTGGDYLRQAVNNFKWADPRTLPERGGPDQLGHEAHDFSRLWTGAFYEVLTQINQEKMDSGIPPQEAIRQTGQEGIRMLANLVREAPKGQFTYRQMAEAFIKSDEKHNGGQQAARIREVFTNREILSPNLYANDIEDTVPPSETFRLVQTTLRGGGFGQFEGAVVKTPVDEAFPLGKDVETENRTRADIRRLIDAGRILMTTPGQRVETKDLFDAQGRPYVGVVTWENGQMNIERVPIIS
jgi:hypothetical protein